MKYFILFVRKNGYTVMFKKNKSSNQTHLKEDTMENTKILDLGIQLANT